MTLEERQKVDKLIQLFAKSKELDIQRANHLVTMVDTMLEALARGNTQSVELGLVTLRRILNDEVEA